MGLQVRMWMLVALMYFISNLLVLRSQGVRLKGADHRMEVFTTHPNMLKRIKRLASLA